jgi:hypothetical protein
MEIGWVEKQTENTRVALSAPKRTAQTRLQDDQAASRLNAIGTATCTEARGRKKTSSGAG